MTSRLARAATSGLRAVAGARIPLKVSCHLTYRCNLTCRYCGRRGPGGNEMSTEDVIALMTAFAKAGCVSWSFNGGEPLLRSDIGQLVDEGQRLGLVVSVVTNGTLLSGLDDTSWILNLDTLLISLDGPREVCDLTRGDGTFDRVMEGLDALPKGGPRRIVVGVLSRETASDIRGFLDVAQSAGAQLLVQPVGEHDHVSPSEAVDLVPSRDQVRAAATFLLEEKARGRPVLSSRPYLRLLRDTWPRVPHSVSCLAGRIFCNITPDGGIATCCAKLDEAVHPKGPPGDASVDAFMTLTDRSACGGCYLYGPIEASLLLGLNSGTVADLGGKVLDALRGVP
ncbi:MAG: radical SAM protein [Candidatus Undinarchaeales archaeon]|nr:radical SAM protein [Candidatus Undinarchaeales archaeon]MDP7493665.1 radical SAM protein [Candidatus Undinarchaeales archaeon]